MPNDPEPPLLLGMIAEQQGAIQRAVVQYEKVLEVDPNHAIALNNLAYLLAETTADLDRALSLVQKARSQRPDDPNIADTLAWIYIKRNLNDSAIQILDPVIAKHPKVALWRYHLGLALFQKGDRARARQELETALRSNPSNEDRQRIRDLLSKAGA
jgi:Flp pilus assembly protein TadD